MPASDLVSAERWIAVAHLLRPQGRRGELLAEPLTDLPEVFTPGKPFRLGASAAGAPTLSTVHLEACWRPTGRNAGRLVLKLAGTDSISAAESLQGQALFLLEANLPVLDQDTFLVRDLVDCSLFDNDRFLGTVTDLQFPVGPDGRTRLIDAVDLLVVARQQDLPEADPLLVPFVKAWLSSVDLAAKRIVMHLPPGLLE